jgi:hypothetical protein
MVAAQNIDANDPNLTASQAAVTGEIIAEALDAVFMNPVAVPP